MNQPPKVPLSKVARDVTEFLQLAKDLKKARKRGLRLYVYDVWSRRAVEVVPDGPLQPAADFFGAN